ncbi:CBO0543 family protein [Bacillus weihaiensis]|uniref:Uncharacterized protein n=1 Tax=Bacillus weihaiensis TaxID=1547283 RepID=A0A1L3MR46_9BACI|nr:CBO0543 family protein [Bacillus weihaiensis]APH04724.1 hypothetical protein A9C19_08165 [Bacillus weihaiensis]
MHIFYGALVLLLSIFKGDWKNWENYYPSMLYIALSTFVYEYIAHSHFHLWDFQKTNFLSIMNIHFIHNLLINPFVAFLFLSNYPKKRMKKILYYAVWSVLFIIGEVICRQTGDIIYSNGWTIWWSALFVITMFPMVRLHHTRKLTALFLSILFCLFYLTVFDYI